MEAEAARWLRRYPVPVMVTAFSRDGDIFSLEDVRPINSLLAWNNPSDSQPVLRWESVENSALPDIGLDREMLKVMFADVRSRTGREIQQEASRSAATQRVGWWPVFAWAVAVPRGVAVLEWWTTSRGRNGPCCFPPPEPTVRGA